MMRSSIVIFVFRDVRIWTIGLVRLEYWAIVIIIIIAIVWMRLVVRARSQRGLVGRLVVCVVVCLRI